MVRRSVGLCQRAVGEMRLAALGVDPPDNGPAGGRHLLHLLRGKVDRPEVGHGRVART